MGKFLRLSRKIIFTRFHRWFRSNLRTNHKNIESRSQSFKVMNQIKIPNFLSLFHCFYASRDTYRAQFNSFFYLYRTRKRQKISPKSNLKIIRHIERPRKHKWNVKSKSIREILASFFLLKKSFSVLSSQFLFFFALKNKKKCRNFFLSSSTPSASDEINIDRFFCCSSFIDILNHRIKWARNVFYERRNMI
jgi:hypothetical protein